MGIFSHPVTPRGTRLFGAHRDRRHVCVLEVDAESASPNALVVPIPASALDGVERIAAADLALGWDGRRRFFDDLDVWYQGPPPGRPGGGQAFFAPPSASRKAGIAPMPPAATRLYPDFETSLDSVELLASPAALVDLEPPARPGPEVDALLRHHYPDHVLALARFPAGLCRIFVAVRYVPVDPTHVFFPLLEVTDGVTAPARVDDDHDVFGQGVGLTERILSAEQRHPGLVPAPPPPFPPWVEPRAALDIARRRGLRENADLRAAVVD